MTLNKLIAVVALTVIVGCSPPPAPVPTPAPVAAPAPDPPPTATVSRADAMIEDLRRREAAQAKFDRENPEPPAPRLEDLIRPASAPVATTPISAPVVAVIDSATPAQAITSAPARDEQWWKNEMRVLQVRASNNLARWQGAISQMEAAQRQMETKNVAIFTTAQEAFNRAQADANRFRAEADNDRDAIERLREDARRASVPPGWLRWP